MYQVSDEFKTAIKEPVKEIFAEIETDTGTIKDSDNLKSFKLSTESGLFKTSMRKLAVNFIGEYNSLLDSYINPKFAVKKEPLEYINFGDFKVVKVEENKENGTSKITAYDKMIETMKPYNLSIEYPITLKNYTIALLGACGLEMANADLPLNNDLIIEKELFENISGITFRDVLTQIAQATLSICIISNDNKVHFVKVKDDTAKLETLTYDNLMSFKLEAKWGEVNSVVLSRENITGEDVFKKDDESIKTNGLTEVNIVSNEFLDKNRESYIDNLYDNIKGFFYFPCSLNTEGLGFFEVGDYIKIVDNDGNINQSIILKYDLTIDGGIKETIESNAETKTQSQYQYASKVDKRIKNTEIIVDKQNQKIEAVVSDVENNTDEIQSVASRISQEAEEITLSIVKDYATISELEEQKNNLENLLKVNQDGFNFEFNRLSEKLTEVGKEVQTQKEWIRLLNGEIHIGKSDNPITSVYTNNALEFRYNGQTVAKFTNDYLEVRNIKVENQVQFSSLWAIRPGQDNNLNDVWLGG